MANAQAAAIVRNVFNISTAPVNHVSDVVHQLWREEVKTDSERADEPDGDCENGFECHRRSSISIPG
jgi:hypothetical protein